MAKKRAKQTKTALPMVFQNRMPAEGRQAWYLLYHLAVLLVACAGLTVLTLLLAYSNLRSSIFLGYWENLWIPLMNLALIYGFCLVLFALVGRGWIAFLLTAVAALGIAIGNYYLIIIRTDALQFEDLTCLREALAITGTQGYELEVGSRVLLPVLGALGLTVMVALLSRWKPKWRPSRFVGLAFALVFLIGTARAGATNTVFLLTGNYKHIDTWSVTEIYASRGVIYPFTRTIFTSHAKPEGYSKAEAEAELAAYTEGDIPAGRKVDVFVVMRESYSDLSELDHDEAALDLETPYKDYHSLVDQSVLWGNLVTNGFGGNTKNAERCFLTGDYLLTEWRKPANSYLWYLRQQGYYAEGAHPFNGWFYNRANVNRYLGFQDYRFREDGFDALVEGGAIAEDDVLFDVVWDQYQEHLRRDGGPYFNFTVTYEGHGPYAYDHNKYAGRYVRQDADSTDGTAMNNYLGCCAKRDRELLELVEKLRASDRPIVLLTFGDHKATLGRDINNYTTSAYSRYGMDVDISTSQGFFNYYSTDYVIWMNDAARRTLGVTGAGPETGPTISPCYLMNVLFDTLGWGEGPAYLQAMGEAMEQIPVNSSKGRISLGEEYLTTIPASVQETYSRIQKLCYYWSNNFLYEGMVE